MENRYLGRNEAPLSPDCWRRLDHAMIEAAKSQLAGRRLLSLEGPFGLGLKAIPLCDSETTDGISTSSMLPVPLIQSTFSFGKRDLAAAEKELFLLDTTPVACAARECALKEDGIIFNGIQDVAGLMNAEGPGSMNLKKWDKVGAAADQIIEAVTHMDDAGFHGPYCMGLAPAEYNLLLRRYPQGEGTELDHVQSIISGDVIKSPVLKKGGILLASGRQFCSIVLGQDMSIGYIGPSGDSLEFSISESLALLIRVPESILALR